MRVHQAAFYALVLFFMSAKLTTILLADDHAVVVEQRFGGGVGWGVVQAHRLRARSMQAGMASKPPRCQRGDQISQPSVTAAARSGWGVR